MSPAQQLKHWQQILETLPTETTTKEEQKPKLKRNQQKQLKEKQTTNHGRKTGNHFQKKQKAIGVKIILPSR